jgi:hypothetical protein
MEGILHFIKKMKEVRPKFQIPSNMHKFKTIIPSYSSVGVFILALHVLTSSAPSYM